LNTDIEIGHRGMSSALPGNNAIKTGKKLHRNAKKEDFVAAPDALAMLTRALRKPKDWIKL
jgi:hypothetical protein